MKGSRVIVLQIRFYAAYPGGSAVQRVGLRPLAFWHCWFELCQQHGCLSLVIDLCCQVEVTARGRLLVQRSPAECVCVSP